MLLTLNHRFTIKAFHGKKRSFNIPGYEQDNLFKEFLIWVKTLFTGKDEKELFLFYRIKDIKNIQKSATVSQALKQKSHSSLRAFWDLYILSVPVKRVSEKYLQTLKGWSSSFYAVEMKIPEPRKLLTDIISIEEMVELFGLGGQRGKLKEEILTGYRSMLMNFR